MPNLHALLRSNGFKFVFGIVYHLKEKSRLKRLKNAFSRNGRKKEIKNRKKLCNFQFFFTTFAKKLKIKELWQKLKRQRLATLCLMIRISTNTPSMV